jgi:hypothetical protein
VLLPGAVDAETLKVDVPPRPELGFHRARDEDGGFGGEAALPRLYDAEFERYHARHFYGTTWKRRMALVKLSIIRETQGENLQNEISPSPSCFTHSLLAGILKYNPWMLKTYD